MGNNIVFLDSNCPHYGKTKYVIFGPLFHEAKKEEGNAATRLR